MQNQRTPTGQPLPKWLPSRIQSDWKVAEKARFREPVPVRLTNGPLTCGIPKLTFLISLSRGLTATIALMRIATNKEKLHRAYANSGVIANACRDLKPLSKSYP